MKLAHVVLTMSVLLAAGCGANTDWVTPERLANGLVIILPGIEGEGINSYSIRDGLARGGCNAAMPISRWGWPVPGFGMLLNQTDVIGNRAAGQRIAEMITKYQDLHPGQPVYVVGHSGGGGVAVFAAEALDDKHSVDGLILLSASLSNGYDLTKALAHCRNGIFNYYSKRDTFLLGLGTVMVGNVDGVHAPSAGAVAFSGQFTKLYQRSWNRRMESTGNFGGHMDSAGAKFVAEHIAPWATAYYWPPR